MKLSRILACLLGLLALALSVLSYLTFIYLLGFPDGGKSELDRAEETLFTLFIWANSIPIFWFFYLGWSTPKNRFGPSLLASFLIYVAFLAIVFAIDAYFRLHLMGGAGG